MRLVRKVCIDKLGQREEVEGCYNNGADMVGWLDPWWEQQKCQERSLLVECYGKNTVLHLQGLRSKSYLSSK